MSSESTVSPQPADQLRAPRTQDAAREESLLAGRSLPSLAKIVLAIVLAALATRLWELGDRPFHHDESLDAWWSWLYRNGSYTGYDPVYHGPLRFYITAGLFEIFGESEAVARLFSALTGTAVVGLPWFLRRELGRSGTIAASVALAVSPTMLYYSRFGREDAQMVFLALLSMVLGLAYLRRPRISTAAGLAFVLACSFAIKESTYLFALLLVAYLLIVVASQFDAQHHQIGRADSGAEPDSDADSQADELGMRPAFFNAALTLATLGLIGTVVIGAAADELFVMIALYFAGLGALVVATAMPRLRSAGINWTTARAAQAGIGFAIAALVLRAYSAAPGPWTASVIGLGLAAAMGVLAVSMLFVAPFSTVTEARRWALALGFGSAGLFGREWLQSHIAGIDPAITGDERFSVSFPMLLIAVAITVFAGVIWFRDRVAIELPALLTTTGSRAIAGPVLLGGIALVLNEYTESEPNRLAAALTIALVIGGIAIAVRALPSTSTPNFSWPPLIRAFGAIGWIGWLITTAVFAVAWYLFFTVFGSAKQDWASGFTKAVDYWDSQQEVNRGGQPWNYYLYALPAYEWFFIILAGVGSWRVLRKPTVTSGLFVWFALGSLIIYSYAAERMPWLIAHPLLPVLILAGYGVLHLWQHRQHRLMPTIAAVVMIGLVATAGTAWRASFPLGADSREILSQAGQATPHLTAALDRFENIDRISRQATGEPATLAITSANGWPYSWYLRDRPNVTWFNDQDGVPADQEFDVIIASNDQIDVAEFPDYTSTLFAMRSWWVPTYHDASLLDWLRWARGRELWDQGPNPNYRPIDESHQPPGDLGIGERMGRLQEGADKVSESFIGFVGADGDLVDDARIGGGDGCGSVDQVLLIRNEWAAIEGQAYPDPIEAMGPLDCVSHLLATS